MLPMSFGKRKSVATKQSEQVWTRLTVPERRAAERAAKRGGYDGLSAWLRAVVREKLKLVDNASRAV
jgi:hypothetical protein